MWVRKLRLTAVLHRADASERLWEYCGSAHDLKAPAFLIVDCELEGSPLGAHPDDPSQHLTSFQRQRHASCPKWTAEPKRERLKLDTALKVLFSGDCGPKE